MADESNKPGNHRHTLIMLLGCLAPLVILGVMWFAGVSQNILSFGILLLCPIMHFLMMKNMKHEHMKHGAQSIDSKMDNETKRDDLT